MEILESRRFVFSNLLNINEGKRSSLPYGKLFKYENFYAITISNYPCLFRFEICFYFLNHNKLFIIFS
ncbi:MAG: hypothetical protein CME68_05410 [Halobacteriovoraceae bacterium]|nr:hypothetical protein [Halobacteriovoraceae bacterium]